MKKSNEVRSALELHNGSSCMFVRLQDGGRPSPSLTSRVISVDLHFGGARQHLLQGKPGWSRSIGSRNS